MLQRCYLRALPHWRCRGGDHRHRPAAATLRRDDRDGRGRGRENRRATTSGDAPAAAAGTRRGVLPGLLSPLHFKYMAEDELRRRFDAYDADGDGSIDAREAVRLVKDATAGASDADRKTCAELRACAEEIIDSMDTNRNRRLEWDEFKAAVDRAAAPVSSRVYPISGAMFINFAGQGVQVPVVPFLARSVGMSTSELGMVTAAAATARIVSNVPAALAAERFGRRPLLVAGPLLGATGMLGFALAPTDSYAFLSLCAANTLCGFGSAMTMAGAGLYLTDISTPLNRSRTMAPYMMSTLVGFMVGPPIGGFVADAYGLQMPFFVTSGALALTAMTALLFLPETRRRPNTTIHATDPDATKNIVVEEKSTLDHWRAMLGKRDILGIASVSFVGGMAQGSTAVTTIIYASETLHMSPSEVGLMFTAVVVAMAAVTKPATDFSDRYVLNKPNCRSTLIIPGLAIAGLATGLQGLEVWPSVVPFTALYVVGSLANAGLVSPNMTPFLVDSTNEEQRAQALAMRNMAQDLGILGGALTLGAVSQAVGVPEAILCSAGLQTLTMLFFAAMTNPGRQRKRALAELEEQRQNKRQ